jgi:hypothetical protein
MSGLLCIGRGHRRLLLSLGVTTVLGCHGASVCEPPGSTSGVFVETRNSPAYIARMNEASGDVPHVACRAESTVHTHVAYVRNQLAPYADPETGKESQWRQSTTPYDPRILTPRENINLYEGQYRILGVGRGLDADDCAVAATDACNVAIEAYFRKRNAVRPLDIPCRVLEDRDTCPASGARASGG